MAGRRGPPRRRPQQRNRDYQYPVSEDVGFRELEMDGKSLSIELKSNDQGYFVKILETQGSGARGKVIMSAEKAREFRSIVNEFVAEYERLPPEEETTTGSERLKTESFSQGRRRYYLDLRRNERGRFLKVTMLAGNKSFVAIPGGCIVAFRDKLVELLDEFSDKIDENPSEGPPKASPSSRAPAPQQTQAPVEYNNTDSREVKAGDKKFYFDVEQNDRGMFIRLSEVLRTNHRKGRVNIPQSAWVDMAATFNALAKDYPLPSGEESTESQSED